MASAGLTIAKRGSSSLLNRIAGTTNNTATLQVGRRSIHNGYVSQFATSLIANPNYTHQHQQQHAPTSCAPTMIGFHSNPNIVLPINSAFAPLGSTARSFGRKGSRMGHHRDDLDEMAHNDSREEAKHRREEKKKKSKKARLSKENNDAPAAGDNNNDDYSDDTNEEGGGSDGDFGPKEDEFGNPLLPEVDAVRSNMLLVVASLEKSFASIRGGEATPELFDAIRVSAYGETVPLSSVGQVVIEDPQRATISCYDPSIAPDVRDAVRDMPGMNLNPYVEEGGSGVVIIPIPRASEETRKEMVKELGRQSENGKQRIRNIRRKAMDIVKKGKDGKLDGISKDDAFRVGKDVDSVTEEVLSVLKEMVEKKQKSVMED